MEWVVCVLMLMESNLLVALGIKMWEYGTARLGNLVRNLKDIRVLWIAYAYHQITNLLQAAHMIR